MEPETYTWSFLITLLTVRFAAVFLILILMQLGILAAGKIISSIAPAAGKKS